MSDNPMSELKKYELFLQNAENTLNGWISENKSLQSGREKYTTYNTLASVSNKDIELIKTVFVKLEKFYVEHKKS